MSRYRKVDIRMWSDEEFRKLSKPAANGQSLFQYCLTGPFTTNIPGLFSAGEAAMAERLEWSLKTFRESFQELSRKPFVKADWKAHLVFVPNAIKYNVPQNPNVVKGWAILWDELPECALKDEAYQQIKSFLESVNEGLGKVFTEVCRNDSRKQEQEQKQEQESPLPPTGVAMCVLSEFQQFWEVYPKKVGKKAAWTAWRTATDRPATEQILQAVSIFKQSEQWTREKGRYIPHPATWIHQGRWDDEFNQRLRGPRQVVL